MFMNAARTLRIHCVEGITPNPEDFAAATSNSASAR